MKPDNDARQALEALLRDEREGMSDAEQNELISRELDKGEGMDADLVAEALNEGHPEGREARKAANWEAIERKLDERAIARTSKAKSRRQWMRAAAAIMAVFALVSIGTVATHAWRWDFLIKIFRPVTEDTMGIHLNVQDVGSAGERRKAEATTAPEADLESSSQTIQDESQVPKTVLGYNAVPSWIPAGYSFSYAVAFNDYNESSLMIVYRKGETELFVQTFAYDRGTSATAVNVMEKEVQGDSQGSQGIEIVENEDGVNATCQDNLACYTVWGRLSREDISAVITSMR
jgi:hypothetical protein